MATAQHNKDIDRLVQQIPRSGVAGYKSELRGILKKIIDACKLTLSVDGGDIQEIKGGFHLKVRTSGARAPWTIYPGSESTKRKIQPGTFGGLSPEIGGVRLDAASAPELTITADAINYIYLRCDFTLTTSDGFIDGASIAQGDVTVIASATATAAALDNPATGLFHVPIGTISATGVLIAQPREDSLDWAMSDTGTSASIAQLTVFS